MLIRGSLLRRATLAVAASLLAAFTSAAFAQSAATKTLRVAFPIAETGFDPQAAGDAYSNYVNRAIFDPLYRYDYLARPYRLVPNTAAGMPEIADDGKTWTIHLRKGIYFADDPVFKGRRRELTAADYVYAIKRVLDPKMRSNSLQMVDGRFVGADARVAKAKETGHFDYDAPIEGLQAIDRDTLRFKLVFADYELLSNLTTTSLSAVAREVIEAHADASGWAMANPVGTGAYRLKDWRRGQRIILEANPGYRDERYPGPANAADRAIAYAYFNMEDPVFGGYAPAQIALRRAIAMGYDVNEEIRVLRQSQGLPATQVVPPGMTGHDPSYDGRVRFDPGAAKALLERFGYVDRDGDGFRESPDAKPLTLRMASATTAQDREADELWKKSLTAIGIRVEFTKQKWPDLLKAARLGQLQMWQVGNINTTPDGFGFFGLLYGKNGGFSNLSRFRWPEFDRLYETARAMPDGAARIATERKMSELANAYAPWVLTAFRYENVLVQPWLRGFRYNPTYQYPFAYLDVDRAPGSGESVPDAAANGRRPTQAAAGAGAVRR